MTLKKKSLIVLVIAQKGSIIGEKTINTLSSFCELETIEAATPISLVNSPYKPAMGVQPVEMAIAVSHHKARLRAERLGIEWTLILEEDAIINFEIAELLKLIEEISNKFDKDSPLGIHLFPEQFGILTKHPNRNFLKVHYLPDYAVGYCLNLSAVKKSIQDFDFREVEIADWPTRIRKDIFWHAPITSLVLHPDILLSTTKSSTIKYRKERENYLFYKKLFRYRIFPLILIKIGHIFKLKFGRNPIESEKIRSIKLNF
jgi:hypothetical protein